MFKKFNVNATGIDIAGKMIKLAISKRDKKNYYSYKYIYFVIGFIILVTSEITVRYSGISLNHTILYYMVPIISLPLIYLLLIRIFKYENLN